MSAIENIIKERDDSLDCEVEEWIKECWDDPCDKVRLRLLRVGRFYPEIERALEAHSYLMPFGKYKDMPFGEVPLKYLDGVVGNSDNSWFNRTVRNYLDAVMYVYMNWTAPEGGSVFRPTFPAEVPKLCASQVFDVLERECPYHY